MINMMDLRLVDISKHMKITNVYKLVYVNTNLFWFIT
jgi:hypothetical protein